MVALALQRALVVAGALREPPLDPLDERVDHGRLHLLAQLLARLDRRVQLALEYAVFAHGVIMRGRPEEGGRVRP